MSGDWWFRHDDETVVWEGTPRLSAALPGVSVGILIFSLAVVAGVLVDLRIAIGSVVGVGLLVWSLLRVRRTQYRITTRALWSKRGVLRRHVRRVGLQKVQNTAYAQSITGSAFGYGTVTLEVAGGDDLRFQRIDTPEAVQRAIADRIDNENETAVPGSVGQWRSVLQEVREIRTAVE